MISIGEILSIDVVHMVVFIDDPRDLDNLWEGEMHESKVEKVQP